MFCGVKPPPSLYLLLMVVDMQIRKRKHPVSILKDSVLSDKRTDKEKELLLF